MTFKQGQCVWVKIRNERRKCVALQAIFVAPVSRKRLRLVDAAGEVFEAPKEDVYPSQEALEASIPHLRHSTGVDGRRTTFPLDPRLSEKDGVLWHHRPAGEPSAFGAQVPDWMLLPAEVLAVSPGAARRRVIRQFQHPSPITGEPVTTRELEGGVFCFETPGVGWSFSSCLDVPEGGWEHTLGHYAR